MPKPEPPRRQPVALAPAAQVATQPADPDLVDHIFDYLAASRLLIADPEDIARVKLDVRDYFGGTDVYIPRRTASERHAMVVEVLAKFNGRNATEIARQLKIGRTTVFRIIKQAGARG